MSRHYLRTAKPVVKDLETLNDANALEALKA